MLIAYQCQIVSSKSIYTSNILQTTQIIFRKIYVYTYTYMHVTTINEKKKESMNLKESQQGYMGGVGGRKENGHDIISKINEIINV